LTSAINMKTITSTLVALLVVGSTTAAPLMSIARDGKDNSVGPGASTDGTRVTGVDQTESVRITRREDGGASTDGTRVTGVGETESVRITRREGGGASTDGTRVTGVGETESVRITGDNRDMV